MFYPFVDIHLARKLERTEALGNSRYVQTKALVYPGSGAVQIEVDGVYAMFAGVDSPLTQTFGLGIFQPVTPSAMDRIETFFQDRQATVFHEVSPIADASALAILNERGYRPLEYTSVLYRPIYPEMDFPEGLNERIVVRQVRESAHVALWAETAARGWQEYGDLHEMMKEVAAVSMQRSDASLFLAEQDGRPIASGGLNMFDEVALMAGASTVPEERNQGAQRALFVARIQFAISHGCSLAMICAQPGSASQRNGERNGFRIAYTRTKWQLI